MALGAAGASRDPNDPLMAHQHSKANAKKCSEETLLQKNTWQADGVQGCGLARRPTAAATTLTTSRNLTRGATEGAMSPRLTISESSRSATSAGSAGRRARFANQLCFLCTPYMYYYNTPQYTYYTVCYHLYMLHMLYSARASARAPEGWAETGLQASVAK